MFKMFIALVLLATIANANGAPEVTHKMVENLVGERTHSVYTSDSNVALTDSIFEHVLDWKTVSINGDQVVIYSPTCDVFPRSIQDLNQDEQHLLGLIMRKFVEESIDIDYKAQNTLVTNKIEILGRGDKSEIINKDARTRSIVFDSKSLGAFLDKINEMPMDKRPSLGGIPVDENGRIDMPRNEKGHVLPPEKPIDFDFNLDIEHLTALFGPYPKGHFLRQGDLAVLTIDPLNFSISKPGLPDDLSRVFLHNDVISFVYNDGRVIMKPTICMSVDEHELLEQLKKDVSEISRSLSSDW